MVRTIRGLMEYTDVTPIKHIIACFLESQAELQYDYEIEELESFFINTYSKGCQSQKEAVALWNFPKIIQEYKEAT